MLKRKQSEKTVVRFLPPNTKMPGLELHWTAVAVCLHLPSGETASLKMTSDLYLHDEPDIFRVSKCVWWHGFVGDVLPPNSNMVSLLLVVAVRV